MNKQLEAIKAISNLQPCKVYFDEFDKMWHVEGYLKFFDTQEEAEKEAENLLLINIVSEISDVFDKDLGFNGKTIEIKMQG